MRRLSRARFPLSRAVASPPRSTGAARSRRVELLLTSGIFDEEYYAAATGLAFTTTLEAARHCVQVGMRGSLSPNPLLDIASVPNGVKSAWRDGKVGQLLAYLRSEQALKRPISPMFHAGRGSGSAEDKRSHPGGGLGLFLAHASGTTLLPVPDDYPGRPPTLDEARHALIERVRETAAQAALTGSRTIAFWDAEEEAAWKSRWQDALTPFSSSPIVSIIMPVRNRPALILRAIESVQQQTLENWQLIVVDDGSTDSTPEEVCRKANQDPRIRLIRAEHGGVSAARNHGIAAAAGEFVAFLDSDNTWRPDFLAVAVAVMQAERLEAAYAAARMVDASTGLVHYRAHPGGLDALMVKNHIDLNTLIVRRDLARSVGGFDEGLRRWVDHDFAIRVAQRAHVELLPFIACDYDDDRTTGDRITTTEHESWQFVVLGKNWVNWSDLKVKDRSASLTSVVIPTYQDWQMTVRAVVAVLRDADESGLDVEVVVLDNGSHREVGTQIVGSFLTEPRVQYLRLPRNLNFAIGCNVGFARTRGTNVVFLNNDTVPRRGWLSGMLPHLNRESVRGVQPLLLYPDDTIQTAGTIFSAPNFLPTHFLVGHPPEDAERMESQSFHAVTAAALLMRASEFCELEGFDPVFVNGMEDVDLCLRALEKRGGGFLVEPTARVTHFESKTPGRGAMIGPNRLRFMERWRDRMPRPDVDRYAELGLTVAHLAADDSPVPSARPVVARTAPRSDTKPPRLRWGIKLPSIPGPRGDVWGDTHFANSLAGALRRLGQEVVTYRHGTHSSSASHLDDVVLGIRGLDVIVPQPGKVNILWVISHPDDVTPEELLGFDLVYAASVTWSAEMSRRSGRPVLPLHQAVDIQNLPSSDVPITDTPRPVFVGGTHAGRHRQAVLDAVEAGVDLVIHGPGWQEGPAKDHVASEYVANSELPALYRSHGLVLADHWPDMARNGFVANRVFDAVASGARVISDDVPGIEALFHGAVGVYKSVEHLRELCASDGQAGFPSSVELAAISARVAHEHSFDNRARTLLSAALEHFAPVRQDAASNPALPSTAGAAETAHRPSLMLHVGMGKTGSSALQVALVRNRDWLASRGICYPLADSDVLAKQGGVTSGNGMRLARFLVPWLHSEGENTRRHLDEALAALPSEADTVLYSSEFLYHLGEQRLTEMAVACAGLSIPLRVVVYVRDIAAHAYSEYAERVKRARCTVDFRDFIDEERGDYHPALREKLEMLRRTLGDEAVTVVHYESVRANLVPHFFETILGISDLDGFESMSHPVNRSLTDDEMVLMRGLNSRLPHAGAGKLASDSLVTLPPRGTSERRITPQEAEILTSRFEEDVAWVNSTGVVGGELSVVGRTAIGQRSTSTRLHEEEQHLLDWLALVVKGQIS